MRVLLVEDNDGDADLVRDALSGAVNDDIKLQRVDRLDAAADRLTQERFDVVLLDLSLPDAIGLEGLQRLRVAAPNAPIVVLTGSTDKAAGTRAIQNGAQDYLQKGAVEGSELLRAIRYARERSDYAERARLLSEVGIAVASSLDAAQMLAALERTLVAHYADWCAVDGADAPAQAAPTSVGPGSSMRIPAAPPMPRLYVSLSDLAPDDPHRVAVARWKARGLTSAVQVPFSVDGWAHGTLTCGRSGTSPPYGPADLALAEEITRRAVAALEHSGLLVVAKRERERAEVAARSRDEFLATLSHELRTPLNAILGWTQMLRAGQVPPEGQARALETIERNTRSQAALIEDVLDVSRIITGKIRLHISAVEVLDVLRGALDSVRPAAGAKGVILELDEASVPVTLQCDPDRLLQILWNLLSNAVKFTPRGGRVRASVGKTDEHLVLQVTDTGVGIEQSFLPHVFERFRQADSTMTRTHGGLGLGLAITRHLVELLGGTIRVESEGASHGASFTVALPLTANEHAEDPRPSEAAPPAAAPTPSSGKAPLHAVSMLVVDDDEDTQMLLRTIFERAGATVVTASSVEEALAALSAHRPHVLVSDIGMPGQTGYDLIRQVRALPAKLGGETVAVALTAYARPEDRAMALRFGFDQHVTKPVETDELLAVLTSLSRRLVAH